MVDLMLQILRSVFLLLLSLLNKKRGKCFKAFVALSRPQPKIDYNIIPNITPKDRLHLFTVKHAFSSFLYESIFFTMHFYASGKKTYSFKNIVQ